MTSGSSGIACVSFWGLQEQQPVRERPQTTSAEKPSATLAEKPPARETRKSAEDAVWYLCPVCNVTVKSKRLRKHIQKQHGEQHLNKAATAKVVRKEESSRTVHCGDCGKEMSFAAYEVHVCKRPNRFPFVAGGSPGLGGRR